MKFVLLVSWMGLLSICCFLSFLFAVQLKWKKPETVYYRVVDFQPSSLNQEFSLSDTFQPPSIEQERITALENTVADMRATLDSPVDANIGSAAAKALAGMETRSAADKRYMELYSAQQDLSDKITKIGEILTKIAKNYGSGEIESRLAELETKISKIQPPPADTHKIDTDKIIAIVKNAVSEANAASQRAVLEVQAMSEKIKKLEEKTSLLSQTSGNATTTIENMEQKIAALQDTQQKAVRKTEEMLKKVSKQADDLRDSIQAVGEPGRKALATVEKLKSDIDGLRAQADNFSEGEETLKDAVNKMSVKSSEIKTACDTLKEEIASISARTSSAEASANAAKKSINSQISRIDELVEASGSVATQISVIDENIVKLGDAYTSMYKSVSYLMDNAKE